MWLLISNIFAFLGIYANAKIDHETLGNIPIQRITGEIDNLNLYKGQVILIVNVASHCGFVDQYAQLEELYQRYRARGLVILGFPSNDFLWQEPGNSQEILNFCQSRYGVSFPMYAKIHVRGPKQHPLYKFLTSPKTNLTCPGAVRWNFNKFLLSRSGRIVGRYGALTPPFSSKLLFDVERTLDAIE